LYKLILKQLEEDSPTRDLSDDAMLTKKHVGPVNCASCEKKLTNLIATQGDYLPWKKLPNERIARYGQGFSKILNHIEHVPSAMTTIQADHPNNAYST